MADHPRLLLASLAHNAHLQQMAMALVERDLLGRYSTGAVDHWRSPLLRALRRSPLARMLQADRWFSRRRLCEIPEHLIETTWFWDILQQCGRIVPHSASLGDLLWEQSELSADRRSASLLESDSYCGFLGTEHQSLASLKAARRLKKPSFLIFTSPHHLTYARWVQPEYDRLPELSTPLTRLLQERAKRRDARRDEEMEQADYILCNSGFTASSLIAGGAAPEKVIAVPLGCPVTTELAERPLRPGLRFLYSGPVSVRKGAPYLFSVWRRFSAGNRNVELHVCGSLQVPASLLQDLPDNVHLHGNVTADELRRAYDDADFLVFPTLCDGFGLVVCEALARGLPVITTTNAGAADLVQSGKNGLVIPPADSDALLASLEWAVDHRQDLPELRRAAWEAARNWSWAHFRQEVGRQVQDRISAPVAAA